jgi:hypothetical protein
MDMLGMQVGIECKHADVFKIPEWWAQTKRLESTGQVPLLVVKQTKDQYAETKVVMRFETLLQLLVLLDKNSIKV